MTTKRILLVDDEEAVLALLSATLAIDDRYDLLFARNGEEAIRVCERERPDLIVLDVMMPDIDGFDVCRSLKRDYSTEDFKVIMLTALAQNFDRQNAMEAGADDYITKPFSPNALLEKVRELLGELR